MIWHGKWSVAGVPHTGWTCIDIEDLEQLSATCEMCETQQIRYVHYMEHESYPTVLATGCICAGHMEGDIAAANERDTAMRLRVLKRKRWLTRIWRTTHSGNLMVKADGFRVIVYARGAGYAYTIAEQDGDQVWHARLNYPTQTKAMLLAFDEITLLLEDERRSRARLCMDG